MNAILEGNSYIRQICEVRFRNIGDGIYVLPISNASFQNNKFFKTNTIGEIIIRKLSSLKNTEGIQLNALISYLHEIVPSVEEKTLEADVSTFILQLCDLEFIEVI